MLIEEGSENSALFVVGRLKVQEGSEKDSKRQTPLKSHKSLISRHELCR